MKRGLNNNVTIFIVLSIAFVSLGIIISITDGPLTPTGKVIFDGKCNEINDSQVITSDTTLDSSCTYSLPNGITIGANNLTLDCNGATLKGSLSFDAKENKTCSSGTGITLTDIKESKVINCNIIDYDIGFNLTGTVKDSKFTNNKLSNMDDYGFYLRNVSKSNEFSGNTLEKNGNCNSAGQGIYVFESKDNMFKGNVIMDTPNGFSIVNDSKNNTITNNQIDKCNGDAILIVNSKENIIVNNTISNCLGSGISIKVTDINLSSKLNIIKDNVIKNNGRGILISNLYINNIKNANTIMFNNILNNTKYSIFLSSSGDINVSNNWWGTADNDTISSLIFDFKDNSSLGIVTYEPFLTSFFGTCTSNWVTNSSWQTCQEGDIQYANYIDTNFCGVSNSDTINQSCDFDGDGFIGNISDVNTTLELNLTIVNDTVTFDENNSILLEFDINSNNTSAIKLKNVFIEKQSTSSIFSYLIVKGIDLNSQGKTKSVYVDKILNSNVICLKDAEINSVSDISNSCDGQNEVYLTCPGTEGSYSCSIVGNKLKITGLKNSGVTEVSCIENWDCGSWGSCQDDIRTRSCTDSHSCGTEVLIPDEIESCTAGGGGTGGGGTGGEEEGTSFPPIIPIQKSESAKSNESNTTENEITAGASVDINRNSDALFGWISTSGNLSKTANLTIVIFLSVVIFGVGGYAVYRKNKWKINNLFRSTKNKDSREEKSKGDNF